MRVAHRSRTSISCDLMELLVVSSCTDEKDVRDCPSLLKEADFDDPAALLHRETELNLRALPAAKLYTGWQHRYMMKGVGCDQAEVRFGDVRSEDHLGWVRVG